ncbi:extracellular triacylglycerol lipase precursor [Armillaria borealis]|uniref:Extracellular triacylglycerol lipase n=1 Tax=Armillaria borealis TaxID=47425 RepID=A0AA39K6T3_9AGAR|nr:extracellular triacylglycerol lipase precursor [Armillaria borealis]
MPLAASTPEVQLGKTRLIGRELVGLDQDFFGGIPFTEPPVGLLRLQRPISKTEMNADIFNAQSFGPACLQHNLSFDVMSEDCLTVNIFRPAGLASEASLPVMFWTFGGGLIKGASSSYNASAIVAQSVARGTPIIYVNYNYRLGPLGFPQGTETAVKGRLNLGLRDQLTALEWVQKNIGVFGGDNTEVCILTTIGSSLNPIMTNLLFLNPSISRMAQAAIFESGTASTSVTYNASTKESVWQSFVAGTPGCSSTVGTQATLDCLQNLNSSAIYQGLLEAIAQSTMIEAHPFNPIIDGPSGRFAKLPFISGTNLDEGMVLAAPILDFTESRIRNYIAANFSPPAIPNRVLDRFLQLYPDNPILGSPYGTGNQTFGLPSGYKRLASMYGDLMFDSPRRYWTQTAVRAGVKAYGYQFTQRLSTTPAMFGVPHTSELDFVYGLLGTLNESVSSNVLSETMIDYWVSFATSLDPNDGLGTSRKFSAVLTYANDFLSPLRTSLAAVYSRE